MKNFILHTSTFIFALLVSIAFVEVALIFLNSNGKNYNIEMWKYSKELKTKSPIPEISHEHKKSSEALLQGVRIRTNSYGMRGDEPASEFDRRILFIGSSITMGWGVEEKDIFTSKVAQKFQEIGETVDILNSGVGNHNSTRYVKNFFENYSVLKPTDIVVHYFLNDAEVLANNEGNFFTRNFQIGVLIWSLYHQYFSANSVISLESHYKNLYTAGSPGFEAMKAALYQLTVYCDENDINLYLAIVPDIHKLENYPFQEIHKKMKTFASLNDIKFVDFLTSFQKYQSFELWNMPNDPHPNAIGHQIMADEIFPILVNARQ